MGRRPDLAGLALAFRRVGSIVLFGVLPPVLLFAYLAPSWNGHTLLFDFRGDLYGPAKAIIHGHDPYRAAAAFLHHLAAIKHAGGSPSTTFAVPVYPAPDLLATVPLALLPFKLAAVVYTLLSVAALVGGLRLLGVGDWRCYGAAFLSYPVLHSLRLGTINPFMVLGVAVIWRTAERLWAPATATAAVVAAKLFLWPLAGWLGVNRHLRTALLAATLAIGGVLASWAMLGFDGLGHYPRMLSDLSTVEAGAGVSLISVGEGLGLSRALADLLLVVVTAGLLWLAWSRSCRPDGARSAFAIALIAGLASSPIVWPHYLTLIFVPIALVSPTLSPLWFVPLIAYLAPTELTGGNLWKMLPYLAIAAIVAASAAVFGSGASGSRACASAGS